MYVLGAVKPWVKDCANTVGKAYGVSTILGVGIRPNDSDHPKGLALDFMVGSNADKGSQVALYVMQHAKTFGVTYIIWQQKIWNSARNSEGWRAMPDRGSRTANHMDHVHVSFQTTAPTDSGGYGLGDNGFGDLPSLPNPLAPVMPVVDAVKWLMDSHNVMRVGEFMGGAALLLVALTGWAAVSSGITGAASKVASTAAKGVPK